MVAGWVGPVDWPNHMSSVSLKQALAVFAYIGSIIGAGIGVFASIVYWRQGR